MGEPNNAGMHNFNYHPSVANWVHTTSLATQLDGTSDEPPEQSPDDFYRSPPSQQPEYSIAPHVENMTTTRQRQISNGAVAAPRPPFRTGTGPTPPTSSPSSLRGPPQPGSSRPTVKSLAQKFNVPPTSAESSPPPPPREQRSTRPSQRSISDSHNPPASPARSSREVAYGPHKFANLKPRERPQPAPTSPASSRRANGGGSGMDDPASPPRRTPFTVPRKPSQTSTPTPSRPLFFGEVLDEHDVSTPGFGIPTVDPAPADPNTSIPEEDSPPYPAGDASRLLTRPPPSFGQGRPRRSPSDSISASTGQNSPMVHREGSQSHETQRPSPPSRIPVASRRLSATSDSGSSTRSYKVGTSRAPGGYDRNRSFGGRENTSPTMSRIPASTLLSSYRDYRERGKSPQAGSSGASLAAVINSTQQPPSPRLRNSRERQLHSQDSPTFALNTPDSLSLEGGFISNAVLEQELKKSSIQEEISYPQDNPAQENRAPSRNGVSDDPSPRALQENESSDMAHSEPLAIRTSNLDVPQVSKPLSSTTDFSFDESPVLGMPGGFMTTPPLAQNTPPLSTSHDNEQEPFRQPEPINGELLQNRTFQQATTTQTVGTPPPEAPDHMQSELGVRESIPIMFNAEESSSRWRLSNSMPMDSPQSLSIGDRKWRAEPLDSSGTISYIEEDDSPTDPLVNRDTIHPDDSASLAFYHQAELNAPDWTPKMPAVPAQGSGGITLDSEAYSVINKVLNFYHQSAEITKDVAHESRQQIQYVSPIVAQHTDWGSKEATETYLARLLSDANGGAQQRTENGPTAPAARASQDATRQAKPTLGYHDLDDEHTEPHSVGTAIIYPPESRRYSRGSQSSNATTILDDASRADGSSVSRARDRSPHGFTNSPYRLQPTTFVPHPPNKDAAPFLDGANSPRTTLERSEASFAALLPEIQSSGEGLGLTLQAGQERYSRQQRKPVRPQGPPPPPPPPPAQLTAAAYTPTGVSPYGPSGYSQQLQQQPQSIGFPSSHLPQSPESMCFTPGSRRNGYEPIADPEEQESYRLVQLPPPEQQHGRKFPPIRKEVAINPGAIKTTSATTKEAGSSAENPPIDGRSLHAGSDATTLNDRDAHSVEQTSPEHKETAVVAHHPAAFPGEDEPTMARRLQRRFRILQELTKTENIYMSDLMVIREIWMGTAHKAFPLPEERLIVFSNIDELAEFAYQLGTDLRNAIQPILRERKMGEPEELPPGTEPADLFEKCTVENDDLTSVGYVMKYYLSNIDELYTKYLLNHENANKLIVSRQKAEDPAFIGWQCACHEGSKDITDAWDLDSLLVKPVQRLLKYPLLLHSLKEVTPPTHDDYADIVEAWQGIIDISNRINDLKRRQETLRQATKEGKKEKKKGFRGIDNMVKALTSKTEKTKSGATEAFLDKEYEKYAQKFGGHFFQIQIIIKDVENYRDDLTMCFVNLNVVAFGMLALLEENHATIPEIESAWRRNAMALLELRNVLLEDHKKCVHEKVQEPLRKLWSMYVRPQKLMDQRKKGLPQYLKYQQMLERKEKIDPKLEDAAQAFTHVNDALKEELPKLYDLTKKCVQAILNAFISYQKTWWRNCQKKILPLLEFEPEHTNSFSHDMANYVNRFQSDAASLQAAVDRLAICNGALMTDIANFQSPHPSIYTMEDSASRKSTSRRTESMSSDMSALEPRHRRSAGYPSQRTMPSFEGPPRAPAQGSVQAWQGPISDYPRDFPGSGMPAPGVATPGLASHRSATRVPRSLSTEARRGDAISPNSSDRSDMTVTQTTSGGRSSITQFPPLDDIYGGDHIPLSLHSSFLSPGSSHNNSARGSTVFQSALPMSDTPAASRSAEELPGTPADLDEPEVLFLAASLFEFNIAHDRREGGIPYLVYVPGEIFDVIGMKGELWLARNQDDDKRTVGWIWEKHFARILPEEA